MKIERKTGKNEVYVKDLFDYFKSREKSFLTLLEKLVSLPTYSGGKENINRFLDFLVDLFSEFKPQVSRFPTPKGDVLCLSLFPEIGKFLVLLAHGDTVKVSETPLPVKIAGSRFHANGCYDMKSGIALFYFILKACEQFDLKIGKQLKIIITPDEETGSKASLPILLRECRRAAAVILPEPCCPGGAVKTRRKGGIVLNARITGKAAHSGIEPGKGIDANKALAGLIFRIDEITGGLGDVSFNPGILSGGRAVNIASPESSMDFEVRSYSNDLLEKAVAEIKKIDNIDAATCEFSTTFTHPALEFDEKNKRFYEIAKKIAREISYELPAGSSGGGSEGSHLSAAGIPVIDGIGLKGGGAHSPDEYIDLRDFPYRAALLTALCLEAGGTRNPGCQ